MRISARHFKRAGVSIGFILMILLIILAFTFKRPSQFSVAEIHTWINQAASAYQVDPKLVEAVIWKESRFFPDARGTSGELGLMQLRQLAAGEWAASEQIEPFSHDHVLHPQTNTLAGTWYLKKMLKRYEQADNPIVFALADYNAGRQHVLRWLKDSSLQNSQEFLSKMDFPTTRQYIIDIIQKYQELDATRN